MEGPATARLLDLTTKSTWELSGEKFSIGRGLQNSLSVEELPVSRVHCVIERKDGRWNIADESTNGTVVDSRQLKRQTVELKHGDVITLCQNVTFRFELPSPASAIDLASEIACDDDVIREFDVAMVGLEFHQHEEEPPPPPSDSTSGEATAADPSEKGAPSSDLAEEMQCSVCSELFYKATTLNCSHTFCRHCIAQWTKTSNCCPICRTAITTRNATLVIDNLVERYLQTAGEEEKRHREAVVKERASPKPSAEAASSSRPKKRRRATTTAEGNAGGSAPVIVLPSSSSSSSSDSGADEEDPDSDFTDNSWDPHDEDYDYWEPDYNGIPGVYYGGYGSCFSCGSRGHWANGCPYKSRR